MASAPAGAPRRRSDATAPAAPALTTQQVRAAAQLSGRALVVYDGGVFDVSSVVAGHPGGARLISDVAGEDVSRLFRGEVRRQRAHARAHVR
jgi:cytochrome b involved in lipid metabolism